MPRSLTVPIGLVDNPYEQRRDLLIAELDGAAGNVAVVGAPRSGKSTAVRTMLLALADTMIRRRSVSTASISAAVRCPRCDSCRTSARWPAGSTPTCVAARSRWWIR